MERLLEFALNHPFLVTLFFALLLLLLWNLLGSSVAGVTQLEPSEMTRLINREHATVVDIRGEEDYLAGHILNAINLPEARPEDNKSPLGKVRNKPVIVYCQHGTSSPRAAKTLKGDGFENVSVLKGGITAWRNAGMPVTRKDG